MPLQSVMLEQLATSRRIVEDGHEVVPRWTIGAAEGAFAVMTRFDPDKAEQRERALHLISRFMDWKLATWFVLSAETWIGSEGTRGGDEALLSVGVARTGCLGVMQRILRLRALEFGPPEWVSADLLDPIYLTLLPVQTSTVTVGEAQALAAIFAESGELPARELS